jgi:hypothetical protein
MKGLEKAQGNDGMRGARELRDYRGANRIKGGQRGQGNEGMTEEPEEMKG